MKILIVDKVHEILIHDLLSDGHIVDYHPEYDYDDTIINIDKYDGLVVRSKFRIDAALIGKGEKLKFLARAGVGLEIFDVEFAKSKSIKVFNAAGANADAVGEHVIGMILGLLHKIVKSNTEVKSGIWEREQNRGKELGSKCVGLIGYGNTGQATARKLNGFGCEVIAYDKYKSNFSDQFVKEVDLKELFTKSDILSLHIPLTEDTDNLVNEEFLNKFKKSIHIINSSRGKVLNTADLYNSLLSKKIKGVGLDVLHNESFKMLSIEDKNLYSNLFKLENVILTPHIAGWSIESYKNISKVLAEKIRALTY